SRRPPCAGALRRSLQWRSTRPRIWNPRSRAAARSWRGRKSARRPRPARPCRRGLPWPARPQFARTRATEKQALRTGVLNETPRQLSRSGRFACLGSRPRYWPNSCTCGSIRRQSPAGRCCHGYLSRDHLLSKLPGASVAKRFSLGCGSWLAFFEDLLGEQRGGAGVGPARVEGEMGDHLADLLARDAVLQRAPEVAAQL